MPRPRDIVMGNTTEEQRREAVIARAVEIHKPYKCFKPPSRGKGWLIVYDDPRSQRRSIVMDEIEDRVTAKDLIKLLERAWVLGMLAARE